MDYRQAFAISAAGMDIERLRLEVTALNLANTHTVAEPGATAYAPMRVIARSSFGALMANGMPNAAQVTIEPSGVAPRMVQEPGHPFADARGLVAYPGIDTAHEMLTMMSALRAYEANIAAMNAARTMAQKALEIGGAA